MISSSSIAQIAFQTEPLLTDLVMTTIKQHLTDHWIKYVPDLLLLFLYFCCMDSTVAWQLKHLQLSCYILMSANIIAVAIGCYSFFRLYGDEKKLTAYIKSLRGYEKTVTGLSAFITAVGFLWWLAPLNAAKEMGMKDVGFILWATAYFVVFLAVVAKSITSTDDLTLADNKYFHLGISLLIPLFFYFSYAFLVATLPHLHSDLFGDKILPVLCLCIFYLPLRIFLLLRPPFSIVELGIFLLLFGFFISQLLRS